MAFGRRAITSEAITASGPCGSAASRPARRCTWTAAQAAWAGASPLASIAPSTPERTSPVPAVARPGAPPGEIATRPVGAATSVSSPLSTTIARACAAAARACASRWRRSRPSRRPAGGRARRRAGSGPSASAAAAARPGDARERVEAVGVDHQRHVDALEQRAARTPGRPRRGRARGRARPRRRGGSPSAPGSTASAVSEPSCSGRPATIASSSRAAKVPSSEAGAPTVT